MKPIVLLLVEDNLADARLLREDLADSGGASFLVTHATCLADALTSAKQVAFDVALLDLSLPDSAPQETVARLHGEASDLPIVVLTGAKDEALGVEAMRQGAQEYLVKGEADRHLLIRAIRYAIERNRAQRAARESDARFRRLVEGNIIGVIVRTGEEITEANDVFLKMVGRTREDLQSRRLRWREMTPPEHVEADERATAEVLERGACTPFEKEYFRKDGSRVPVLFGGSLLSRSPLTWICFALDLTAQVLARKQVEDLAVEAEKANHAKDDFLAVLSHEMRTPLTPVLLTASLLEARRDLPQDVQEDIRTIQRNVQMEARLIDDLLDLTRVARGKFQFEFVTADVHLLVRAAADVCWRGEGPALELHLEATQRFAHADPARMQQVFWNLLNNARKFTSTDGRVAVRSSNPAPGRIRVEVSDTGRGIPEAFLPRLFEAFQQVERERGYGGLGLGLAISKAIVDAHRGTLEARSAGTGKGTTFTVELAVQQVATPEEADRAVTITPCPSARALSILVVEDHAETLAVMSRMLRELGHDPHQAASIHSALEAAERGRFDGVLCDLGLPDGSGHDLMRMLRERHGLRGIAVSGYGMEHDRRRSRDAGFIEHLTKPVSLRALEAAIGRLATAADNIPS